MNCNEEAEAELESMCEGLLTADFNNNNVKAGSESKPE